MRVTLQCFKSVRKPQNEATVPFKARLPLKLRDHLSGKSQHGKEKGCWYEMTTVLACLEQNNFDNKHCQPEIDLFQSCYNSFVQNSKIQKELQKNEVPKPESKHLTYKQLGYLLRRHPNH